MKNTSVMSYVGRWIVLWMTLWWFGFVYLFGRIGLLFRGGDRSSRRRALMRHRGRTLRRLMTRLGATFVKLGQVMATRPDLVDPDIIDELRALQDRLPPFPFRDVRRLVEAELGGKLETHFAEFDQAPVAAASVAQVHRARLPSGEEVAVKVLRPDIREKVQRDAVILHTLARMIAWHPTWRLSDPVGHLDHFVAGIVEQTRLDLEAQNYVRFRANFMGTAKVRFPKVYPDLSAERVMTMDFIRGTKIDALPPGGDHRELAVRLQRAMLKMCFVDRFVHADLHPGNMIVDEAGDLVLFDVGLVKAIDDSLGEQFTDLVRCLTLGTPQDFVDHARKFHTYVKEANWDAVLKDASNLIGRFRGKAFADVEMGDVMNDLFAMARRHRVRPPAELALVLVAIVTSEGIGKQLNASTDVFSDVAMFLAPILAAQKQVSA
jgi:ubiquinone biosynthesis protein